MGEKTYLAIDLKSFYASVECVERKLDPLKTHLVVADASRTDKTICLAVSPPLKALGVPGRPRLFEVVQKVRQINSDRSRNAKNGVLSGSSCMQPELDADPSLALSYIVATPRMAFYMEYSTKIYRIYMNYVSPEDIHVYSIDEVFIDVTHYLATYRMTARELAMTVVRDVLEQTGITATVGIGSNLYLAKIAMDIVAKHIPADKDGVRIAELDEQTYRRTLWEHRPLTDFWRVGRGYTKRLEQFGLFTMGDIALCSLQNEDLLYRLFGVNAELLIDHAWGREPCTIADIKAYRPLSRSICSGQVLSCPYSAEKARIVVWEMADQLALDLFDRGLVTDQITVNIGYDGESLSDDEIKKGYHGAVTYDAYGRMIPKGVHTNADLPKRTSSGDAITQAVVAAFDRIVDRKLLIRRLTLSANRICLETDVVSEPAFEQMDFFTDYGALEEKMRAEEAKAQKEKQRQSAVLYIKKKFGKNAILKGTNLQEGATAKERNGQVGGHKA